MARKTANVTARIKPDIKETAEAILERLGIPVSVFIDMTYRQVIMHDGVPFSVDIPQSLPSRDALSAVEFDTMMRTGLEQAKKDDSLSASEVFQNLRMEISNV
ncbi:MAG: type II toxin-antitoxin system RelB/DinJ family antitoxin [Lachnospiraceae bacterium]|nr:type II toxin-antitoxin system RelB/DinJ family antitoxin [Lachnospiraceae bacterium]